jgi:hypothetical protein
MRRARVLDSLRVVTPCPVKWASMKGDDAVRFCDRCQKNVYNVAALSPAEAVALIERAEGRVCMVLTRRADGTVVTGDCWAQLRRARKRGLLALATAAPVIIATTVWSQSFGLRALASFFRAPPSHVRTEVSVPMAGGIEPPAPELPSAGGVMLPGEVAMLRHQPRLMGKVMVSHPKKRSAPSNDNGE